ncbi:MAG: Unknown protein [uncultured Sulfurovum sp.]|uniref:Uncharacterized protein n=1 Tax=uncultured Sulfurovum sp. TaxID=269237 RepID=A0A6S6UAA1_9BACT|nr:MAG: Unknown protein [uncultured Sulfurovum sp.]
MKITILLLLVMHYCHAIESTERYSLNSFIEKALEASFALKQDETQLHIDKSRVTQSTL